MLSVVVRRESSGVKKKHRTVEDIQVATYARRFAIRSCQSISKSACRWILLRLLDL